jgi:hypothetical protein
MRRSPGGGPLRPSARPLALDITKEAASEILKAREWLKTISSEASQSFLNALNRELRALCKANAYNPATQRHDAASIYFSRPTFHHRFQTGQTKTKRSSSGVWYIYFELVDTNADQRPDTLRVNLVTHAAKAPLWEEPHGEDEDEEESA